MDEDDGSRPLFVIVGDSPDARLFIELSSHAADLTEASEALRLAMRSSLDDASTHMKPFLIGFAAVSYCRCFLHSNVRAPVSDQIDVPHELIGTHDRIRVFRNQTIAHSQSELAVTYPVGVLDEKTRELRHVSAVTVTSTLPDSIAKDFARLLSAVLELVDEALAPVRERLEQTLRVTDLEALAAAMPRAVEKMADEFQPRSRRARYPTGHTFYWDREESGS